MCSALPFRCLTTLVMFSRMDNAESLAGAFGRQVLTGRPGAQGISWVHGRRCADGKFINSKWTSPLFAIFGYIMEGSKKSWLSIQVLQDILRQRKQLWMKLKHVDLKRCPYLHLSDIKTMGGMQIRWRGTRFSRSTHQTYPTRQCRQCQRVIRMKILSLSSFWLSLSWTLEKTKDNSDYL